MANRRWIRRDMPFPNVVAQNVFLPEFYAQLAAQFAGNEREALKPPHPTPGRRVRRLRRASQHPGGPVPESHIDADMLGSYGRAINSDGLNAAEIGPCCRLYAGQTDGRTGLLDEIRATIDGYGAEGVGYGFSKHYRDLANVYKNTGTRLQNTAKLYAHRVAKTRQILDGGSSSSAPKK